MTAPLFTMPGVTPPETIRLTMEDGNGPTIDYFRAIKSWSGEDRARGPDYSLDMLPVAALRAPEDTAIKPHAGDSALASTPIDPSRHGAGEVDATQIASDLLDCVAKHTFYSEAHIRDDLHGAFKSVLLASLQHEGASPAHMAEGAVREAIRNEIVNTPETADFMSGVPIEATHQRERWPSEHDAGKSPFDWFWLVGYLAQKAADAAARNDLTKAQHHTISAAAALANWHAALTGADTSMRPGIEPPLSAAPTPGAA